MKTRLQQWIDATRRELEKHETEWRRAGEGLQHLGDTQVRISRDAFDQLEATTTAATIPTPGAVRA